MIHRPSGGGSLPHWVELEHQETSKPACTMRHFLQKKPHLLAVPLLTGHAYSNHHIDHYECWYQEPLSPPVISPGHLHICCHGNGHTFPVYFWLSSHLHLGTVSNKRQTFLPPPFSFLPFSLSLLPSPSCLHHPNKLLSRKTVLACVACLDASRDFHPNTWPVRLGSGA